MLTVCFAGAAGVRDAFSAAFAGKPMNAAAVDAILASVRMPVQLGGGIRDLRTLEAWLAKGIARVIIGTAAVRDPAFVRAAAMAHPGKVAVGIDARDGFVAVEGWAERSNLSAAEISRDGMLAGLDIEGTLALADAVSIPVIASGGLASIDDVKRLLQPDCVKLDGAITGRALYDGRLDAAEALALIRAA